MRLAAVRSPTVRSTVITTGSACPMTIRSRALGGLAATTLVLLALPLSPAHADDDAVPTYEVKIDLTTAALDGDHQPLATVADAFGISGDGTSRSYEYADTSAQDLDASGWDVRLRHKSGKDFEETYKFRIPVENGDIDAALDEANDDGFDASDTNYDAEVDWGYSKQTLSFSNDKSHDGDDYSGTSMPSSSTAIDWLVGDIPGKLEDWTDDGWGKDTLQDARIHGPVTSNEWEGSWEGTDSSIEVLPVKAASGSGTEYVVEASFKTDDYDTAAQVHADAISVADDHGWLDPTDVLKTQLILDRY